MPYMNREWVDADLGSERNATRRAMRDNPNITPIKNSPQPTSMKMPWSRGTYKPSRSPKNFKGVHPLAGVKRRSGDPTRQERRDRNRKLRAEADLASTVKSAWYDR
jgi:hypothetical protein